MPAMIDGQQPESRIRAKSGMIKNGKRNELVVFCLDDQRGHADRVKKTAGRLCRVIPGRRAEAEPRRRKGIVELLDRAHPREQLETKQPGLERLLGSDPLLQALEKAVRVKAVFRRLQPAGAGGEVDRYGDRAYRIEQVAAINTNLAGELQSYVPPQREARKMDQGIR